MITFTAGLIGLLGLVLAGGGAYLAYLGGSLYFLIAGAAFLLAAIWIARRQSRGLWLFALALVGTYLWALWESGYSWWPLASRVGLPSLLGLWMILPPFRRAWARQAAEGGQAMRALSVLVGLAAVFAFGSILNNADDIDGRVPNTVVSAEPDLGPGNPDNWTAYGRNIYGQRYSPLDQINKENIGRLKLAWQIQTGDVKGPGDIGEFTYEATPIKVGDTLYLCTPHNWLVALDADSGKQRWVFNPEVGTDQQRQHQTCRGVSYYAGVQTQAHQPAAAPADGAGACNERIFLPTSDAKLYAVNPKTGELCRDFAQEGVLDLMHNMPFKQSGYYYSTSAPLVAAGQVIVAGSVNDNYAVDEPSGVIRAYDAMSGKLMWNWDAGHPDDTTPLDPSNPNQKYATSSPNSWSTASADEKLGLAYFPMGNRTPDQLGMYRSPAEEKYSSSVVALDLKTGQARWVQQFVHHDLWDMDTPAQPSLVDITTAKGVEPGLVVPTKQGDVYVLNRATGEAIIPIGQVAAGSTQTIPEDWASPVQPVSGLSFNPEPLSEKKMWGASLVDQMLCRIEFNKLNYSGRYTPPSLEGTIVYPGNFGVFNWGSIAVDPKKQVMFGMPLHLAFVSKLIPQSEINKGDGVNTGEHGVNANAGAPYGISLTPFLSPIGVPCQQPPWGFVAAAGLQNGKIYYQRKNGTIRNMNPLGLAIKMGVPGIGGPMITGSGVVFMAAAVDNNFRAYDLDSGDVLWNVEIPAGGQATPMTYLNSQGEQMVVLVAGGHGSVGTTLGDYVLAYKLEAQ